MQSTSKTTLGELFRERRTALRKSMREVAGTTLSPTAVNNIEKGKINPTVETVLYLCSVLGLAPEAALIHCSDFSKSAPALLEIADKHLAANEARQAVTLLYDMTWVVSEQERYEVWQPEIQLRLGLAFAQLGEFECAKKAMHQAYYGFFLQQNIARKLVTLYHLGRFEFVEGNLEVAVANYRQALDVVQRYKFCHRCVGDILYELAETYLLQDKPESALHASQWAEHIYRKVQLPEATARTQLQLSAISLGLSRLAEAEQLALQAKQFFAAVLERDRAAASEEAGDLRIEPSAPVAADDSIRLHPLRPTAALLGQATRVLGDVYAAAERWDEARAQYAEGLSHLGGRFPAVAFEIQRGLAEAALCLREIDAARGRIQTALELCAPDAARESRTAPLEKNTGMQTPEAAARMQDLRSGGTNSDPERLSAAHQARAYQLLARCEQLAENRAGYVEAMTAACTTLSESGDALQAALLQTQLADETDDWELMRSAAQTLRRLHERLR